MHGINNFLALDDLTEDGVLSVEPGAGDKCDEELRAVGVWAGIGHGEEVGNGVLSGEVLVGKLGSVDGLATGAVLGGEVTTLGHKVSDHSVEGAALVVKGLSGLTRTTLTCAECAEILSGLGSGVSEELELNSSNGLATDVDVEENLGVSSHSCCCC